jgi:hypothetical protein
MYNFPKIHHPMTQKTSTFLMIILMTLCGCGKPGSEHHTGQVNPQTTSAPLNDVLTGYLKIKDALVRDDAAGAKSEAAALLTNAENLEPALAQILQTIADNDDIDTQRKAFEMLSVTIYPMVKSQRTGITLYKQFCPMAFDDKGAFWLSSEKQVLNPYFGSSMLKCGTVQEVIE